MTAPPPPFEAPEKPTAMSQRLLIVDDSRMSRLILQGLVLQAYPQWTILHASSGEEALAMVEQHAVDIVSMDFNMHGMNGLEAALALRKMRPHLPIAILTANVQSAVQERIEEAGLAFIAKPITAEAARKLASLTGA